MPSLDRSTLESQLQLLSTNHKNLLDNLQRCSQSLVDLQKQMEKVQSEMEQYRGALSYSQHIQEQTHKVLEQAVAAEMAAKLSAESAAKNTAIANAPFPVPPVPA